MRVWRSLDAVPADLGRTVVTIGNFDGVHSGHCHVIERAHQVAEGLGLDRVVAVTFDPHPVSVLRPEQAPLILSDIQERVELLARAGVDDVLVVPFTRELAEWSPEQFVADIVVRTLHAAAVVVGANFRFGRRAAGDVDLLRELGSVNGFVAEGVPLDGGPQIWSSTYVRARLGAGDVEGAAEALGRPVSVHGVVERGDRRGRELGYPTANIATRSGVVPADGVYAGWLHVVGDEQQLPAAISVGVNPTFAGDRSRRVEAYVLDRDDLELYDREVEIVFVTRLREMLRFDSVEELVEAMRDDVDRAREVLRAGS